MSRIAAIDSFMAKMFAPIVRALIDPIVFTTYSLLKEIVLMSRFTSKPIFSLALALLTACSLTTSAQATIVGAQAHGDDLAGGTISVQFTNLGLVTVPIVVGGPDTGIAGVPNQFVFSVSGDTYVANWRLSNLTTFDTIETVRFNLATSASLFDDGSLPDTDFGFAGRQGAVQVNAGAPFIIFSNELILWPDPMNQGDEYLVEIIQYRGFGPQQTSVWSDDTDIIGVQTPPEVPEPTSALLLLVACAGLNCHGQRRR